MIWKIHNYNSLEEAAHAMNRDGSQLKIREFFFAPWLFPEGEMIKLKTKSSWVKPKILLGAYGPQPAQQDFATKPGRPNRCR